MSTNPLASFIRGSSTVGGMEQAQTTALANQLYREQIQNQYDAGESAKALAYLANDQIGIYKMNVDSTGAASYTLREDWEDRYNALQRNEPDRLGQSLLMDRVFGQYLSKTEDGQPVKKKNQKVFAPYLNQGVIANSVADTVEADSNVTVKEGKDYSYSMPVINERGIFSLKTILGTDLPDDTQPISLTRDELQTALQLVPAMHGIVINPDANRAASGTNDLIRQGLGAQGSGQNNVTFTGMNNTNAVIDVPRDEREIAEFILDDNSSTPSVVALIKQMHEANKIEGKQTVLASSGDQTQTGAPAPTPAPAPALAPTPQSGNVPPRPAERFNEWDEQYGKDYNFDGTPKIPKDQVDAEAAEAETARKAELTIKEPSEFTKRRGQNREAFDPAGAEEYLNSLGITLKRDRDSKKVLEALNSLEAGESISGRMGAASLGQSTAQYLVTALGGKNSDYTGTRGQSRTGTYDQAAAEQFIKSKLNIPEAGAVSEVQGSGPAVFTNEQVGQGDPVTDNFSQTFPEFEGLDKNQIISQVQSLMTSGEFAQRGFSQEQVTNIRGFLEQQNINNLDDMKQAVDQGVIRNPYLTSLSINLLLAGPDGMVGGQSVADATEKMENFITTGISTRDAKELTDSVQAQQRLDTASSNAFLRRVEEQNRINENLRDEFIDFTTDLKKRGKNVRKYLSQLKLKPKDRDKDFDSTLRDEYAVWESGFDDNIRQITNSYGGVNSQLFTDVWRQTERGRAGIDPTPRDMIRYLIEANAFKSDKATSNMRDALNLRVDIAAETVLNGARGTKWPIPNLGEWFADFPRRDESDTGSLRQLFKDRLVLVTDVNGNITKIAGKARTGTGYAFQAEEEQFIGALVQGGIPLDQIEILIEELSVEGDQEVRN